MDKVLKVNERASCGGKVRVATSAEDEIKSFHKGFK